MRLHVVTAACLFACLVQTTGAKRRRQVRWFATDLDETVALVRAHRESLTGLYPGFSAAGMLDNGSFVGGCASPYAGCTPNNTMRRDRAAGLPCDTNGIATEPYQWASAFRPLGLTVEPVIDASPVALADGTAHVAISALVRCAVNTNITGYLVDFESFGQVRPANFSGGAGELAHIYTGWLHQLGTALHAVGKTLGVCVSDYGMLGEYSSGYGSSAIDTVMTMSTYYNMANQSKHATIGPLSQWNDVSDLWSQWLIVPQLPTPRPPAAKASSCAAALHAANCSRVEGGGKECASCLSAAYHKLMAAKCSPWPCPGPHSSACFTTFTDQFCKPEGTQISAQALSAGIGQMTTRGCGCENGTRGCCEHIASPLTDKAFAAQPMNYPPACHTLGSTGNCFFWTEQALRRFVGWCADTAHIDSIDIYRGDFNAPVEANRHTAPYYFGVLKDFLNFRTAEE